MSRNNLNQALQQRMSQSRSKAEREYYRNQLVENNLDLAESFVRKHKHYRTLEEDVKDLLISEAHLAIIQAAEAWVPDLASFSTYAFQKIRSQCSTFILQHHKQVDIPLWKCKEIKRGEAEAFTFMSIREDDWIDELDPETLYAIKERYFKMPIIQDGENKTLLKSP